MRYNAKELFEQSIDLFLVNVKMGLWIEFLKPYVVEDSKLELTDERVKEAEYVINEKVQVINDKIRGGVNETK